MIRCDRRTQLATKGPGPWGFVRIHHLPSAAGGAAPVYDVVDDPHEATFFYGHGARQALEQFERLTGTPIPAEVVPMAQCGCCGTTKRQKPSGRFYRGEFKCVDQIDGEPIWRCEKHVGRAPCCVAGCGKTFALRAGEGYDVTYICGKHWRMAPKRFRDLVALIRKRAKKRGWTDKLYRQHNFFWHQAVLRVDRPEEFSRPPAEVMAEIDKMFGWAE